MKSKEEIRQELGRRLLLGEMMARNARKFPNKEALVYGDTRLNYRQFNARINRLAHALMDVGVKKGDKVSILAYNCNQFMETYFALAKIGGVAVPINFRLHPQEMTYIVNQSDAKALIVGEDFLETVKGMQKDLSQVKTYISIGEKPVEGMLNFEKWISGYSDDEPLVLVDEDDPLFIMYTAGTTGRPKGAVITHRNEMVLWMLGASFVLTEPGMSNLWRLPGVGRAAHISPGVLWFLPVHVLPGGDRCAANQGLRSGLYHGDDREGEDQCPRLGAGDDVLRSPDAQSGEVRYQFVAGLGIIRSHSAG